MTDLISRRAAIKAIDDLPNCYNGYSDTYDKAYIIGVLEELPSVKPKPSPDWNGWENGCGRTYDTMFDTESWKTTATDTPMVEYAPVKKGKWIDAKPMSGKIGKVCSRCGDEAYWDSDYGQQLFDYCPYC